MSEHSAPGFTLIEMAIVLVIVALLLGGMMMPLSVQIDQRKNSDTQKALDEINQALIGFAILNGRLPRPAASAIDGSERAVICATESDCAGFIPWAALGVSKLDAWNNIFRYKVTMAYTTVFSPATARTITVRTRNNAGALVSLTLASDIPAVVLSHGKNGYGSTSDNGTAQSAVPPLNVDETTNATGTAGFVSRPPGKTATDGEFDDIVVWLSPNILFNRMIAAGKLP